MNGTEFMEKYCQKCGSQRCEGIGTIWFSGCPHKDELLPEIAEGGKTVEKKYETGMYLGRFQPFHNGHKAIVDKMLEECEQVVIVIGSSDKKGTVQNPFPAWERGAMIDKVYPKETNIAYLYLPDRATIANDSEWGNYVMEFLHSRNFYPDAIYQGFEAERNTWYENYPLIDIVNVSRLNQPISATLIRAAMVEGRLSYIKDWCPAEVAEHIRHSIYWGRKFHE